jgi:hypothetical protein
MRLVVIIVAVLMTLGVAASGLFLAQKRSTPIATAASMVDIGPVRPEASALPSGAQVSQITQAAGSKASPLILEANVDAQSGSPTATTPSVPPTATAPNAKENPSIISKAMVHETTRLKDDATGWAHKLQELELDLKLQLGLKESQDLEAAGKTSMTVSLCYERRWVGWRPMRKPRLHCTKKRSPFAILRSARRYIQTQRFARRQIIFNKRPPNCALSVGPLKNYERGWLHK